MIKKMTATLTAALSFISMGAGISFAQTPSEEELIHIVMDSDSPQKMYESLSEENRIIFLRAMYPVETTQSISDPALTAVRSSGNCREATHHQDWKSNYGFVVATSWISIEWCSSGNRVTNIRITNQGGETSTPGYTYQGVLNSGAHASGPTGRAYSEIGLKIWDGVDIVHLLPALHPCIKMTGHANGSSEVMADINAGNGCRQI